MEPESDLDREKRLKGILSDYEKFVMNEESMKKASSQKDAVKERTFFVFKAAMALIAAAAVLFITAGAVKESGLLKKKHYWAIGQTFDSDYMIQDCIKTLWQLRSAIDAFYANNMRFPDSLNELYANGKISKHYACPASDSEYVMVIKNGRAVFCCPNPDKHDVTSIWCDVKSGPPTIERY